MNPPNNRFRVIQPAPEKVTIEGVLKPSVSSSGQNGSETASESRHASAVSGLTGSDFTRIVSQGFGDPQNSYVHSMCIFQGYVYAGTSRHLLALLRLFPPRDASVMDPWPIKVPPRVQDLDLRAEIWRMPVQGGAWERVHQSPLIAGRDGEPVPRDFGYRGMAIFQGRSDSVPALYVSAVSSSGRGTGARILRSLDGVTFEAVSEPGLGNPNVSTFRSLAAFDGYLYAAPAGEGKTWNTTRSPVILRSNDPLIGNWEPACVPGFGDTTNAGIFEVAVFDQHLYASTFNYAFGYQVWKTPANGGGPARWSRVIERGAYRGNLSEMAMSMAEFNGALYIGSGLQNGGYDRTYQIGPAAGEVIRVFPDNSWDLICGSPRRTPQGEKKPLSGLSAGFDNYFSGYIWRMVAHAGCMYIGTFDWSVFLLYAQRNHMLLKLQSMVSRYGVDQIVQQEGGFDLWRSSDGAHWSNVTRTGFDNPYNYGARTMISTPQGLLIGTANPFGPQVATKMASGWAYIDNPHGGAEIWLGK